MQLDRLGWAAGTAFRACGKRVGIRVSDARVLERVRAVEPPVATPLRSTLVDRLYSVLVGGTGRGGVTRLHVVYSDADMIARARDLDEALRQLEVDLQLYVAESSQRRLFVHAGVVGWRGRAIVIPGRSCSGKSTLVHSLVAAGATYYSDEYALLDARGRVHPYPGALALGARGPGQRRRIHPEALGAIGTRPLPVGLVLATHFRRGARFRPRRLPAGEAVLALLQHTVRARRAPRQALRVLSRAVAGATALRGVRGEAGALTRRLLES